MVFVTQTSSEPKPQKKKEVVELTDGIQTYVVRIHLCGKAGFSDDQLQIIRTLTLSD